MIKVRLKFDPSKVVTYPSRKHILDLERWDMVLEIVHDDEAPKHDEGEVLPETDTAVSTASEPEVVQTLKQLEESPKRKRRNKTSSESRSEDEQE